MTSKRDVLFATQYYGTYDCSKCIHVFFKHLLVSCGNPLWQGFLCFFNTSDYINAGFKCQLVTLHFLMMLKYPHLSQWLFLAFGVELLLEAFSVLEDLMDYYASHNICKNLICEGLCTSHVYFSNHEGWNTRFMVCLSFPLTTVLEKKPVYEGGGVKWLVENGKLAKCFTHFFKLL